MRIDRAAIALWLTLLAPAARGGDAPSSSETSAPVSFLKDVAPILVKHCAGCHNPKKSEGRYDLTTFARLAEGPKGGEAAFVPGNPESSQLVESIRPDAEPRMPYKQDPLPPEKAALLGRWVQQGAKYDGDRPDEDWVALSHKRTPVVVPEAYPSAVPITALAFRPDGGAVVASGYHEVTSWDTAEGSLKRRLRGVSERVHDLAYSSDGRWLAAASGDPGRLGSAKLWKIVRGDTEEGRELVETQDGVFAIAFSPDSRLVSAAGADRIIRIWEVDSGELISSIEDHADWILGLAFSPDGKKIATASRDKTSKVFDVSTKETIVTFPGHAETVYTVAFSPDGKRVATGGGDNQVRIWDPYDDGKQVRAITGFGGAVLKLRYAQEGEVLVASSADGVVRILRGEGRPLELRGHRDWVFSLAVSPDGRRLASGSWDGEVRLWDLADAKPLLAFRALPGFKGAAKPAADAR